MTLEDEYWRRADDVLRLATGTRDQAERRRLIQDAVRWRRLAAAAPERADLANDEGDHGDEAIA